MSLYHAHLDSLSPASATREGSGWVLGRVCVLLLFALYRWLRKLSLAIRLSIPVKSVMGWKANCWILVKVIYEVLSFGL